MKTNQNACLSLIGFIFNNVGWLQDKLDTFPQSYSKTLPGIQDEGCGSLKSCMPGCQPTPPMVSQHISDNAYKWQEVLPVTILKNLQCLCLHQCLLNSMDIFSEANINLEIIQQREFTEHSSSETKLTKHSHYEQEKSKKESE